MSASRTVSAPAFGFPSMSPPIHVPKESGSGRARHRLAVGGDQLLRRLEKRLLEEPEAVADLVDHPRPLRAHLVRLPEDGDLLGGALLDTLARVELGEQRSEAGLGAKDRAPGGLGRMRGEDELERHVRGRGREGLVVDAGRAQPADGVGQRLARRAVSTRDVAAPPDAVVLLGDVRELEVEREGAENLRLLLEVEPADGAGQLGPHVGVAGLARPPGDVADLLLARQQILSLLLDHDAAEQVAEKADVPSERRVGRHDLTDYGP